SPRALFAFLHDVGMAAASFGLALYLRLGNEVFQYEPRLTLLYGGVFTAIAAAVFLGTGLYRGIWRYASLPDLFSIARAVTVPVLGTIESLETVVATLDRRGQRPQKLVVAAQTMTGEEIRRLLDRADALAIPLARLPRLTEFRQDLADPDRIVEPIAVEDLLG